MCNEQATGAIFLSNLVYEVVNISPKTYINLVKINPIVFNYNRLKKC